MLKEKIVIIGHLGACSAVGSTPIGKEINNKQRWLNKIRQEHIKVADLINSPPQTLVFLGENTEGTNPKGKHKDIYKPHISDQIDESVDMMMEYVSDGVKDIYLVYSHEYHEEYSHTKEIRDKLELELLKKGYHINIELHPFKDTIIQGKTFRFIHGNGGSGKNRTSKLESDLKENKIRAADGDTTKVDYIFSSHTHRIGTAGYGKSISHTVPCYKLLDSKGEQMNPDIWYPDIGLTIVTFEERFGEIRVNIDDITSRIPFRFEEILEERNKWEKRMKEYEQILPPKIEVQEVKGSTKMLEPKAIRKEEIKERKNILGVM
jgi:hypothetical protein